MYICDVELTSEYNIDFAKTFDAFHLAWLPFGRAQPSFRGSPVHGTKGWVLISIGLQKGSIIMNTALETWRRTLILTYDYTVAVKNTRNRNLEENIDVYQYSSN